MTLASEAWVSHVSSTGSVIDSAFLDCLVCLTWNCEDLGPEGAAKECQVSADRTDLEGSTEFFFFFSTKLRASLELAYST